MLVIRMSRHGAKKRPFYQIVVADSRFPRDGRYIEKVGTYNPMLPKDSKDRAILTEERIKYWIKNGAQPSERVARILHAAALGPEVKWNESPKKSAPRAKAQERLKAAAETAEAAKSATEAPAAETPAA
ncbi:MAG: 30S ribosomal protein S16 [Alphaproteobacteria bacterium]|nr:30S ribosomal protein S16 [Alphaproteobacteria bacterium]